MIETATMHLNLTFGECSPRHRVDDEVRSASFGECSKNRCLSENYGREVIVDQMVNIVFTVKLGHGVVADWLHIGSFVL